MRNVGTPFVAAGSSHTSGFVPDPGSTAGTAKFLREDGTWVLPARLPPGGRLTLSSTDPCPSADQTGATALHYLPANDGGNSITLWDGTNWIPIAFTDPSTSLGSSLVPEMPYDVYGYLSSGSLALELLAFGNSVATTTIASPCVVGWSTINIQVNEPIYFTTTGALPTGLSANTVYYVKSIALNTLQISATVGGTAINTSGSQSGTHTIYTGWHRTTTPSVQDGYLCKGSGSDKSRLWLGTIRASGTTTCEDSNTRRYCWNLYNQQPRTLKRLETTANWNYSTGSVPQQANAATANKIRLVCGLPSSVVRLNLSHMSKSTSTGARWWGIGVDDPNHLTVPMLHEGGVAGDRITSTVFYEECPGIGCHDFYWLEWGTGAGTQTWYGYVLDTHQTGFRGVVLG